MKRTRTDRGFDCIDFTDMDGRECSLQKSSLATNDSIWLGMNNTGPYISGPKGCRNEHVPSVRMHLNRVQVQKLLPYLYRFVKTGHICEVDAHAERADREGITREDAKLRNFYDAYDAHIKRAVKGTNLK